MKRTRFWYWAVQVCCVFIAAGCATQSPMNTPLPEFDKVFYVMFEDNPELASNDIYLKGMKIGDIISQKSAGEDVHVAKISIDPKYDDLMKDNVIFMVDDGRLEYDTVDEEGQDLNEGAKILGFTGKTSLYWFRTKNKVRNVSNAAVEKAEELYNRVVD